MKNSMRMAICNATKNLVKKHLHDKVEQVFSLESLTAPLHLFNQELKHDQRKVSRNKRRKQNKAEEISTMLNGFKKYSIKLIHTISYEGEGIAYTRKEYHDER